jgi:hypothetical protein
MSAPNEASGDKRFQDRAAKAAVVVPDELASASAHIRPIHIDKPLK